MRLIVILTLMFGLQACSSEPKTLENKSPKVGVVLAELPPLTPTSPTTEKVDTAATVAAYHRVEGALPDASDNRAIQRRLGDLGRRLGAETDPQLSTQAYTEAIARYERLLADPTAGDTEYLLYHLAEAYDGLDDHKATNRYLNRLIDEFPDSEYRAEAHFRRAELAFSANDYKHAVADYDYVVKQGRTGRFWQNANYMLGWSQFKQGDYDESLQAFLATLGAILDEDETPNGATQEMLDDTLRAVVLAVNSLDGAQTLTEHFKQLHKPRWQYRAYARLAEDLHQKQRIRDSVAALDEFVRTNPFDSHSVAFAQRGIEILAEADFPSEARERKEVFVAQYGFDQQYWVVVGLDERDQYSSTMNTYLLEVAKLSHRDGQKQKQKQALLAAAQYYEQFIRTFPLDPAVGEVLFLQGDALTDANEPARALTAYQRVVHEHPTDTHAPDAAYASVVTLGTLLHNAKPGEVALLTRSRIDAQIEYATLFPTAPHAAEAQADAANTLFENHEYAEAMDLATALLQSDAHLSDSTALTATLIVAQGALEQAQYAVAETNYRKALTLTDASSKEVASIKARLVASIYKQAEAEDQSGNVDASVRNFLRIAQDDPQSELAPKGHLDAVAVYESAERWGDAADLLESFRERYPKSDLAPDLGRRLANFDEKAGRKLAAAREFNQVALANKGTEVGQAALYHAAELYTDDDPTRALETFRTYVDIYPTPASQTLEAAHHIELLYVRTGQTAMIEPWLRKQVELVDQSGTGSTDRGRYLAASAQTQLAAGSRGAFDAIKLSGDLKKSLTRKQEALKATIAAYEKAASYGVAEFATASTYEIADTYAALARELVASPAPATMSDLEREQYTLLLEEQAAPFEELAISIHEINVRRSWGGGYDDWVAKSFDALRTLFPARYARPDVSIGFVDALR